MFTFTIRPDDGAEFECPATSRDIVRWERGGKGRSVGRLTDEMKMTDLTDLAWYAADRRGLTALDIVQWRDGVDLDFSKDEDGDEDGGEDGEASDPTRKGRSAAR